MTTPLAGLEIVERAERLRCEQGFAAAPQHLGRIAAQFGETPDQRGLADTGLARHQGNLALAGRCMAQGAIEAVELIVAFEQEH